MLTVFPVVTPFVPHPTHTGTSLTVLPVTPTLATELGMGLSLTSDLLPYDREYWVPCLSSKAMPGISPLHEPSESSIYHPLHTLPHCTHSTQHPHSIPSNTAIYQSVSAIVFIISVPILKERVTVLKVSIYRI